MKYLRTVGGLFALIVLFSTAAYGCSCVFGGGAVCEDYWKASAVFVGTVIDSKAVTVKQGDYYQSERLVRFSIDEPFRGAEGPQIEVTTGLGGGDCGIGFKQSQQYLVYASSFEGKLYTGICMRTKGISAAAADLEYMRGLKKAKTSGVVYGEVTAYSRDDKGQRISRPIAGATITIEGPEKTTITTDKKGEYRVPELPTGDYTVVISPPPGLTTGKTEHKINLAGGGCAVVSFWLENDGRLSGRVVNPQGLPVNKAELFLIESGKERYQGHWDAAYSDEDGSYVFKRIPAGRYILTIRFDGMTGQNRPFPLLYHPGVSDKAAAKVITIGEGQTIADYNLEVPPLPPEHEVTGKVLWSDGTPAVGARVEYLPVGVAVVYPTKNEGGANFSLTAYEGLRLTMRASIEPEKGKYVYSDWVEVTVISGLPAVKLILRRP